MADKKRLFLDANVVLDHLLERQPFVEFAHRIFALAESVEVTLFVSALSFSNLYYILRKLAGHEKAISLLRELRRLVTVAPVAESEIDDAFRSNFADFEDAIQHASAKEAACDAILTRDVNGFKN